MKRCSACKQEKQLEDFHRDKGSPQGRAYYCKLCACANSRKNHKIRHKERRLYGADRHFKQAYGLTLEEYENKLQQQNECAICKRKLERGPLTHLDHCHNTGKIREFLCSNCNRGLGSFHDSPNILQQAIDYLEKHQ